MTDTISQTLADMLIHRAGLLDSWLSGRGRAGLAGPVPPGLALVARAVLGPPLPPHPPLPPAP